MKKLILILGSVLFLAITLFSGCQTRSTKIKDAEEKVQEAKIDLAEAKTDLYLIRLDTISNYDQFKKEAEKIIIAQEKNIADFKAWLVSEKKEIDADHNERLVIIEKKNSELKTKLANFKEVEQDKWLAFRDEFNRDMNELGKSLKDFTVDNVRQFSAEKNVK
jgi:hypothetical protein